MGNTDWNAGSDSKLEVSCFSCHFKDIVFQCPICQNCLEERHKEMNFHFLISPKIVEVHGIDFLVQAEWNFRSVVTVLDSLRNPWRTPLKETCAIAGETPFVKSFFWHFFQWCVHSLPASCWSSLHTKNQFVCCWQTKTISFCVWLNNQVNDYSLWVCKSGTLGEASMQYYLLEQK